MTRIHDVRHSHANCIDEPRQKRLVVIRARAADWCDLSGLMMVVRLIHGESIIGRAAAEWERMLDEIARQEGLE